MSGQDPADLITQLVDHVFALSDQFLAVGDAITAAEDLSAARWLVLGALQDGPMTPAEIARKRGLSRQSIRESVHRLERSGHIARLEGADRRTFLVGLTVAGRDALARIEPRRRAWAASAVRQIDGTELRHAVALLGQLRATTAGTGGSSPS